MKVDRRRALALLGFGATAPACATTAPGESSGGVRYMHGVASGDPADTGAVLWTRLTVDRPGGQAGRFDVAIDPDFTDVVSTTRARTGPERDYTVKAVVDDLLQGREYWFRFVSETQATSPVGRFRTLPERADDVVLAVVSCALHPGGLFNAYDAIAKLPRVDAVLHLGDYIYEYGAESSSYGMQVGRRLGRIPDPPHEIKTLDDYRRRHAQYKSDPDLQAAHARAAWISVWDDHEVTNDGWLGGAENHTPETEGDWAVRKAAALKAYYEWMPIREPAPGRSAEMIDRSFRFGDVASLHMLETRLTARGEPLSYQDDMPMAGGRPDLAAFAAKLNAPERTLLGGPQTAALKLSVEASVKDKVAWQVLGQQIVMARVNGPNLKSSMTPEQWTAFMAAVPPEYVPRVERLAALFQAPLPFNLDAWDGYPAERERVLGLLKAAGARPIVLAGDSHAFWVNALHDASGARVAAEFGTTSITSPGFGDLMRGVDLGAVLAAQNEDVVYSDQGAKGFTLLRLTKTEAVAELVGVSTITAKPYETRTLKRFRVTPDGRGLSAPVEV